MVAVESHFSVLELKGPDWTARNYYEIIDSCKSVGQHENYGNAMKVWKPVVGKVFRSLTEVKVQ